MYVKSRLTHLGVYDMIWGKRTIETDYMDESRITLLFSFSLFIWYWWHFILPSVNYPSQYSEIGSTF